MNSNAYDLPVELWRHIFSLACLDDGSTGRSLSLVSTHFRSISAPFKYQTIAITNWSRIIAFSQIFCKLPASQKKTVSLYVHHPHPILDLYSHPRPTTGTSENGFESSEESKDIQDIRDDSTLPECNDGDEVPEVLDIEGPPARGSDDDWEGSDGVSDSEFEGSLDSEEGREISEDVEYLKAVRNGLLPYDGNIRDDILRDADIKAYFDNALRAFHAILNEIYSTLQFLAVHWTSFRPLQIHEFLPPLPRLVELHVNRSSFFMRDYFYEEPPTTALFPKLLYLYITGHNPRKLSFCDELARIAPNLAYLRFSMSHFRPESGDSEGPKHKFNFSMGRIIIGSYDCSAKNYEVAKKRFQWEFGIPGHTPSLYLADEYRSDNPEIGKKWWTSQTIGEDELWRTIARGRHPTVVIY